MACYNDIELGYCVYLGYISVMIRAVLTIEI